jgi:hypothetical protein
MMTIQELENYIQTVQMPYNPPVIFDYQVYIDWDKKGREFVKRMEERIFAEFSTAWDNEYYLDRLPKW